MEESRYKIIYLIDYFSHTSLSSKTVTDFRFAQLLEYIMWHDIDFDHRFIVSMSGTSKSNDFKIYNLYRERFYEIKNLAQLRGWKWIELEDNPKLDVSDFEQAVYKECNIKMNSKNTEVIFGGTNTSGCVFESMQTSLIHFLTQGYRTKLHLPFCAEAQMHGSSDSEKNLRAYAYIFSRLKTLDYDLSQLDLTQYVSQLFDTSNENENDKEK